MLGDYEMMHLIELNLRRELALFSRPTPETLRPLDHTLYVIQDRAVLPGDREMYAVNYAGLLARTVLARTFADLLPSYPQAEDDSMWRVAALLHLGVFKTDVMLVNGITEDIAQWRKQDESTFWSEQVVALDSALPVDTPRGAILWHSVGTRFFYNLKDTSDGFEMMFDSLDKMNVLGAVKMPLLLPG